jgi:hypothetical protein
MHDAKHHAHSSKAVRSEVCSKVCTNGRLAAQLHSWDSSWRIHNHGTTQGGAQNSKISKAGGVQQGVYHRWPGGTS